MNIPTQAELAAMCAFQTEHLRCLLKSSNDYWIQKSREYISSGDMRVWWKRFKKYSYIKKHGIRIITPLLGLEISFRKKHPLLYATFNNTWIGIWPNAHRPGTGRLYRWCWCREWGLVEKPGWNDC